MEIPYHIKCVIARPDPNFCLTLFLMLVRCLSGKSSLSILQKAHILPGNVESILTFLSVSPLTLALSPEGKGRN
jgi:hypothetical protein